MHPHGARSAMNVEAGGAREAWLVKRGSSQVAACVSVGHSERERASTRASIMICRASRKSSGSRGGMRRREFVATTRSGSYRDS